MDQPNNEWNISSLPPEVMVKIFEYLPFKQRLTASRTCKAWYKLAFSQKFCREILTNFTRCGVTFEAIRAYQNYRNARVSADVSDVSQSAIADFLRAAPLESMWIKGTIEEIHTLLNDHLLSMDHLTTLGVSIRKQGAMTEHFLRISHPSLKSIEIGSFLANVTFEINCPCLTDLHISSMTLEDCEKAVQLVIQLQEQLQSLHVEIYEQKQLEMLADANLNNLKKLRLYIDSSSNGIELLLNKITNLEELQLVSDNHHVLQIGEGLALLKHLSKLSLSDMVVDTADFELALRKMEKLQNLDIDACKFIPPTASWHITSDHIRNLSVNSMSTFPVMLPHCPKLKSLKWLVTAGEIDDIFVRACNSYPQLESLHLGAITNTGAKFSSSTTFPHIKQAKMLKELQLSRMTLNNVDWTECSGMEIEKLQLNYCETEYMEDLLMVQLVDPQLQHLFLNRCNQSLGSFRITKPFIEWLRKQLPWCRISCEFYDEIDATWGGDEFIDILPQN